MNDKHRVTVLIDSDDGQKINHVIRLVLGLQAILSPDVSLDYAVELSEVLIARENLAEDERNRQADDEPF